MPWQNPIEEVHVAAITVAVGCEGKEGASHMPPPWAVFQTRSVSNQASSHK